MRCVLVICAMTGAPLALHGQMSRSGASPRGSRPIGSWLVAGAFPVQGDSGSARLVRAYIPNEGSLAPAAGEAAAGGKTWRAFAADSLGRVDLNIALPDQVRDNAAAYAMAYVFAPTDRTVRLLAESDDDVVIWLNGTRVFTHDIARGMGEGDTIVLRLSRGVNRLLYKVVNRSGGFGVGGRVLVAGSDNLADLNFLPNVPANRQFATAPAPALTVGPVTFASRAVLEANGPGTTFVVPFELRATRWGGLSTPLTLTLGSARMLLPAPPSGESVVVKDRAPWSSIAQLIKSGGVRVDAWPVPTGKAKAPSHPLVSVALPASSDGLLTVLSRLIDVQGWKRTTGSADAPLASAAWTPIRTYPDAEARGLGFDARVPDVLAGLSLMMDIAEFGPRTSVRVNGTPLAANAVGQVTLCSPCTLNAPLAVTIGLTGAQWWDLPRLRVKEFGWAEIRDGATWAQLYDSKFAAPAPRVADQMLEAALLADKASYFRIVDAWVKRLGPVAVTARRDTMRMVGNSHIDAAWLWRWPETVEVVRNTWRTATKLMQKYPEMHFTASAAQYYVWLEQKEPNLLTRIQELDRLGRWTPVGGWWIEPDVNMPSGESLVRQGLYGQRTLMRLFGHPARVAWIPDTFGYPWTLPQIFSKSGMDFFVTQKLRWNDTNKWPSSLNDFWWQGPDGTRVFAHIPYGYDDELKQDQLRRQWKANMDSAAAPDLYVLYGVGDHGGGPTMEMLDRKRDLERVQTTPAIREQAPPVALDAIRVLSANAPTINDELYLEYHRGVFTTQADIKRWNRTMEGLLGAAEAASTLAPRPYSRDTLTAAWQKVLFNQFHDILSGSGIGPIYVDAKADYHAAEGMASRVLTNSIHSATLMLDTRPPRGGEATFAVFNPSGANRTGVVRIYPGNLGARAVGVVDERGRALTSVRTGDTLHVLVPDVPATGLKLIFTTAKPPRATASPAKQSNVLENKWLRVEINPRTGDIARMYDKQDKFDVLARGGRGNGLVLIEDRPAQWDAWNIDNLKGARTWLDRVRRISYATDAIAGSITVERGTDSARVTQRYALPHDAKRLDIQTMVDWRASHKMLKAVFPIGVHIDTVWAEIPYGVIPRTTRPASRVDSARFEVPMQRFVDAYHMGYGVAIANDSKYGYDASGDTVRLTLLRSPKWPDMNADMGVHQFTYSIAPHLGDFSSTAVLEAAENLNQPLRAFSVTQHEGRGRSTSFVRLEGGTVTLGALKRAEDGDASIIRLVENSGQSASTTLHFASPATVIEADMLERPTQRSVGSGSTVSVAMKPWEIRTLFVRTMITQEPVVVRKPRAEPAPASAKPAGAAPKPGTPAVKPTTPAKAPAKRAGRATKPAVPAAKAAAPPAKPATPSAQVATPAKPSVKRATPPAAAPSAIDKAKAWVKGFMPGTQPKPPEPKAPQNPAKTPIAQPKAGTAPATSPPAPAQPVKRDTAKKGAG
jgi:alpha-mannosidase